MSTEVQHLIHQLTSFSVDTLIVRNKCKADENNVNLPMPKNEAENQWYQNYAAKANIPSFWLGFDDLDVEGEWTTDDGKPQTYFKWRNGQPNNWHNQDFLQARSDTGEWEDNSGDDENYILCTYILAGTVP